MAMMSETATDTTIQELNRSVTWWHRHGLSESDAVLRVAQRQGMTVLHQSDYCVLYRLASGRVVNAWLQGARSGVGDGGAGFDDQVEIHAEEGDAEDQI